MDTVLRLIGNIAAIERRQTKITKNIFHDKDKKHEEIYSHTNSLYICLNSDTAPDMQIKSPTGSLSGEAAPPEASAPAPVPFVIIAVVLAFLLLSGILLYLKIRGTYNL